MSKISSLPKYRRLDSWADPEDSGRLYTRTIEAPGTLVLPPEFSAYVKRRGTIYRVELSQSGFSWCLYVDDCPTGWDQRGYYVRTLVLKRNGDRNEALRRARKLLPEEPAFWLENGFNQGSLPGDEWFDEWFESL